MSSPNILVTDVLHVDSSEVEDGRLPEHLVVGLATNVIRTLVQAGIDPNTVYFRGREGQVAEDARRARYREMDADWLEQVNDYGTRADDEYAEGGAERDPYSDILGEEEARKFAIEQSLGRQIDGPPNPEYTLATIDGLLDPGPDNPIYDAGVQEGDEGRPGAGSYLDVYDAALISSFEPGFFDEAGSEVPIRSVSIPEEQLGLAALATVRLNYRVVNEGE